MVDTPIFIDKVVNMTAILDLEMMEYSLLKTLEGAIKPQELVVLRFNQDGEPCYHFSLKKQKLEIIRENIVIPEEILAGIEIVSQTMKPYNIRVHSSKVMTIWHVLRSKDQSFFLVTTTTKILNEADTHIVKGLLAVYQNFYTVLMDSQLDELTGLSNRKTFNHTIRKIHLKRERSQDDDFTERRDQTSSQHSGYWLGMCDLDNFKRVNDNWGHMYGDEVLLLSSQLMQDHFREDDHLFRFGGEEFVIIIYAVNQEKALLSFERFRIAMEEYSFPQVGQVTISIGVTKLDPTMFTATLMDQADKALYYAKKHGRNQVCLYEKLVENSLIEENKIKTCDIVIF
ncbi:MAG: two-component system cell cycle response regulator [Paraglaciecola sp.]|jgi:two-component system cell cycle response regulator